MREMAYDRRIADSERTSCCHLPNAFKTFVFPAMPTSTSKH